MCKDDTALYRSVVTRKYLLDLVSAEYIVLKFKKIDDKRRETDVWISSVRRAVLVRVGGRATYGKNHFQPFQRSMSPCILSLPLPAPFSSLIAEAVFPFTLAAQVNTMIWGGVADVDGGGGTTRGYFPESEDPQLKLRSNSGTHITNGSMLSGGASYDSHVTTHEVLAGPCS